MLEVTIRPHIVFDARRKENVEFDQYQILLGQRVVGYLGKTPGCRPCLVIKKLPQDALNAIEAKATEVLGVSGPPVQSPVTEADRAPAKKK